MIKLKLFATRKLSLDIDIILLAIRLVYGYAFILISGWKIKNPFTWISPDSSYAGFFQALAAVSEFYGGIAIMVGLFTRLGAFGIACTMAVALHLHYFIMVDPFVNLTGGSSYQLPAIYFLIAILFMFMGPGRFSLDRVIFGQVPYTTYRKKMIEVFKTNVNEEREANQIVALLSMHFPGTRINFDLHDCDKILRLEGEEFMAWDVINLVNEKGYQCSILE